MSRLGFTQPAATQTLQVMQREGLIEPVAGKDRRERRFALTAASRAMIPQLESIWAAIAEAAHALDAALPHSLSETVNAALRQLERQPFGDLINKGLSR